MTDLRYSILRSVYALHPFDIRGDASDAGKRDLTFSCIIPTFDRWRELETILHCLAAQSFPAERFEVIVVEDGNSQKGKDLCSCYQSRLDVRLLQTDGVSHCVGALRNRALEVARGDYVLFLDDDTKILQSDFLSMLHERFVAYLSVDCIQIAGSADSCLLPTKYSYLDEYSFATRCVAYRRERLARIGGFIDTLKSYEDIEMSIRFILSGGSVYQDHDLRYYHPPLYFRSWGKTITNGLSFLTLFNRYSFLLWFLCYLNAVRFLPLLLSPSLRQRQWGKISAGFLMAPFFMLFGKTERYYR